MDTLNGIPIEDRVASMLKNDAPGLKKALKMASILLADVKGDRERTLDLLSRHAHLIDEASHLYAWKLGDLFRMFLSYDPATSEVVLLDVVSVKQIEALRRANGSN